MNRYGLTQVFNAILVMVTAALPIQIAGATALDDYVAAPDASYAWSVNSVVPGSGYTDFVIDLKSQTWLTLAEVDRTLWEHWLIITVPDTVSQTVGLLYIDSGSNGGAAPGGNDAKLIATALATNSVTARLRMVPNQPLTFTGDVPRVEDEQIAYAWDKYLTSGDPKWLSRLPMTKAAVRAMDTITAFCATPQGGSHTVDQFVVSGASKRGWTTWTTAAADNRVVAIAPLVIDLLNLQISFEHHFAALGRWAPSIQDYVDMDIPSWFGTPEFAALLDEVGPYSYRDRYTMPKFVMNSAQDQFFLPDSSQFYWKKLPGEKYLRYVPNAGHSLSASAWDDFDAWYAAILSGTPRPEFSWAKNEDGSITVNTVDTPTQVLLWQATNPNARDFNIDNVGGIFTSSVLAPSGPGEYTAQLSVPASGWTAFFVELTFASGGPKPFKFTTEVSVIPDVLPYGPQFALGTETEMLDAAFYAGEAVDGSDLAGRSAFFAQASNGADRVAFWAVNNDTQQSAVFVVDIGDSSSWQRLTADAPNAPDAPIWWTADDSALLVGDSRVDVNTGAVTQPLYFGTYTLNDTSMTRLPMDNWIVTHDAGDMIAIPVLADGTEDGSRQPKIVTNLTGMGIDVDWPAVNADGTAVTFADYRSSPTPGIGDQSDIYILKGLQEILAAPYQGATQYSTLAPTSLDDDFIIDIRSGIAPKGSFAPFFSADETLVFYSEEWNRVFRDDDFFASLAASDFDIMIARAHGFEPEIRLAAPGNQVVAVPTPGGTRLTYIKDVAGITHLMIATLEVSKRVGGTIVGAPADNDIAVFQDQHFTDASGTQVDIEAGTTIDFPAGQPQEIQITTPIDPAQPVELPAGVDAIPVIREFGPEGTQFSSPITVTISYTDRQVESLDEPNLEVFQYNTVSGVFDIPVTTIVARDLVHNTISFTLDHFSTIGIGTKLDTDGDGISDDLDPDDDNDGYLDGEDPFPLDTDNDGIPNNEDPDDDADGILDGDDALPYDTDNDGLRNDVDTDDDNDGYADEDELANGTDPLDPLDFPGAPGVPLESGWMLVLLLLTLGLVSLNRIRRTVQRKIMR